MVIKYVVPEDDELCLINNQLMYVPVNICENKRLLKSLLSLRTWCSLSAQQKGYLMDFLPPFTRNDADEKQKTIELLFSRYGFTFGRNPASEFQENLYNGFFDVTIVAINNRLKKLMFQDFRQTLETHYFDMLKFALMERELFNNGVIWDMRSIGLM